MQTLKRRIALLGCLGITGLAVVGTLHILRHPPLPLDHATALAQTMRWLPEDRYLPFPMYYWMADNALIYFGTGADGKEHLFQRPAQSAFDAPGSEGPVVQLHNGYPGKVSPDGKWFVEWHQNNRSQGVPTFVSMDGTQRRVGPPTWASEGIWTSGDNRSAAMLCGVWRNGAAIDVYHPDTNVLQNVVLPGLTHFYSPQCVDSRGRWVGFKESGFIMRFANLARLPKALKNTDFLEIVRVDPAHLDSKPEQWKVNVPDTMEFGTCVFAPTGDRLLWNVRGDPTTPVIRKLKSYIPSLRNTPVKTASRWLVSGLHGEDMQEIADFPLPTRRGEPVLFSTPRWMPDGRHISFIYRNTLYTRPID